ncbi:MAG TPA: hypothetical protein VF373_01855 [Prolixibacteraceae bacterium]
MNNNEIKNVLKGQHNPAQGNALGLKTSEENVRAMTFFTEKSLIRTKVMDSYSSENNESQFRPKEVFSTGYLFRADGFLCILITQGVALG